MTSGQGRGGGPHNSSESWEGCKQIADDACSSPTLGRDNEQVGLLSTSPNAYQYM